MKEIYDMRIQLEKRVSDIEKKMDDRYLKLKNPNYCSVCGCIMSAPIEMQGDNEYRLICVNPDCTEYHKQKAFSLDVLSFLSDYIL